MLPKLIFLSLVLIGAYASNASGAAPPYYSESLSPEDYIKAIIAKNDLSELAVRPDSDEASEELTFKDLAERVTVITGALARLPTSKSNADDL